MSKETFAGVGTTLSSKYYMRNFYVSNRDANNKSKRSMMSSNERSLADSMALKRAVKHLGSFTYDTDSDLDIRCSVNAFINTYNNALSSFSESDDHDVRHGLKQMKAATDEYSDALDKIGVTVNEDGTLASRDGMLNAASLKKIEKIFSSDSDYMTRIHNYSKRIAKRADELNQSDKFREIAAAKKNASADAAKTEPSTGSGTTEAAKIMSASLDLELLSNTGKGKNINLLL